MLYFKTYQRADIWNYYHLIDQRDPPSSEVVNFLHEQPMVEFREYNLSCSGSKIDYDAFGEVGVPISAEEYYTAYQRATAGPFSLYINGKLQSE